jgi:hypothetical protein
VILRLIGAAAAHTAGSHVYARSFADALSTTGINASFLLKDLEVPPLTAFKIGSTSSLLID